MNENELIGKLHKRHRELFHVESELNDLERSIDARALELKNNDVQIAEWREREKVLRHKRNKLKPQVEHWENEVASAAKAHWLQVGGNKRVFNGVVQIGERQSPRHAEIEYAVHTILEAVSAEAIPISEAVPMLNIKRSEVVKAHKRGCIVAREILLYEDVVSAKIRPDGLVKWKESE